MKQKIIGIYDLGFEQAQLVLREDIGGEFYCIPEKGSIARIKIGADQQHWSQIVAVLLHETFELLVMRAAGRWSPCSHLSRDHAAYLFSFNHTQFSDICAKQGGVHGCGVARFGQGVEGLEEGEEEMKRLTESNYTLRGLSPDEYEVIIERCIKQAYQDMARRYERQSIKAIRQADPKLRKVPDVKLRRLYREYSSTEYCAGWIATSPLRRRRFLN